METLQREGLLHGTRAECGGKTSPNPGTQVGRYTAAQCRKELAFTNFTGFISAASGGREVPSSPSANASGETDHFRGMPLCYYRVHV